MIKTLEYPNNNFIKQNSPYVIGMYMANYQKIDKKFKKCWRLVDSFFALDLKPELDAEALVLPSGPKLLCFVVQFTTTFDFVPNRNCVRKSLCLDLAGRRNHIS